MSIEDQKNIVEHNKAAAALRAEQKQKVLDKRKRDIEIRGLYQQTKNWPWHQPGKHSVASLARQFDISEDEVRTLIK